jgi:hypothetical protein
MTAATTGRCSHCHHCRCRHRRQRRGCAATTVGASTDSPPSTVIAAPPVATPADGNASTPTPPSPLPTPPRPRQLVPPSSPEVITLPAKRTRRQRNEVVLLQRPDGEGELLLYSLSCTASPPLSLPLHSQTSSTASLPLLPLAPLELVPASPSLGPPDCPRSRCLCPPQRRSLRRLRHAICLRHHLRLHCRFHLCFTVAYASAYRYRLLCA